ncbi:MAG: hypothetical protein R3F59_19575 [Myxococcota bacterium]
MVGTWGAGGPLVRVQLRPDAIGRWWPHLGLGAGLRLNLEAPPARVALRLDVVGEPHREVRRLGLVGATSYVASPALAVGAGLDLLLAVRPLRAR